MHSPRRSWRPSHSPVRMLLLGFALLLALAGCGGSGSSAAPSTSSSVPSPSAASSSPFPTYVALGDSYSAGPLIPVTDVADGCFRSDHNYPSLVAEALHSKLVDRTCSGAETKAFTTAQYAAVPPQETALDKDTSLVTVGLGGNDEQVFRTLTEQCPSLRASDPTGSPCEKSLVAGGSDKLLQALARTEKSLAAVLAQVHRLAPKAEVLAIGYPQLVSADHVCGKLPLATGDYAYLAKVNRALTGAVQKAATASGATYVDVWKLSAGHDICSADPWINGSVDQQGKAPRYHPFAVEHAAVAKLVESVLASES
jgi:lysophospholipase L1-like esterase